MLIFIGFIILILYISSKASGAKADVLFYEVRQKLSELDKRTDELDKRTDELDRRTAELDKRTDELDRRTKKTNSELDSEPDQNTGYFY